MTEILLNIRANANDTLTAFNRLSLEEGSRTGCELGDIVQQLVRIRDDLILARRDGAPCGECLGQVNAILSTIFGTEFPVDGLPWKRVCEARSALKDMVATLPAG